MTRLEEIRERHRPSDPSGQWCDYCGTAWPCSSGYLLGVIERVREWVRIDQAIEGPLKTWCSRCNAYVEEAYSSGQEYCKLCRKTTEGAMDDRLLAILNEEKADG